MQSLTPDEIKALRATGPGAGTSGVAGIRMRVLTGYPDADWHIARFTRSAGKYSH